MEKRKVPSVMGMLATAGYVLRKLVYAGAVDEKNLIVAGHPFVIALWALTAAALVLALWAARREQGTEVFEENFSANSSAFLGHGLLGVGMILSVCLSPMPQFGLLGTLWKALGFVSPVCLVAAGFRRMQGKRPFFALYAAPCLFFAVHVVAHYQIWCSNPQFTDYAFALLGAVCLSLHSYQLAAYSADIGKKSMLVLTGLAAVYLCGAELAGSMYPWLYFGGILFCLTNLLER